MEKLRLLIGDKLWRLSRGEKGREKNINERNIPKNKINKGVKKSDEKDERRRERGGEGGRRKLCQIKGTDNLSREELWTQERSLL